ncbi:MAG: cytochrome c maturation protein CcmE [Bacillota bacterium]
MNNKVKLIIASAVIIGALGLLIAGGLNNTTGSYLTIQEALAVQSSSTGKFIQMEGNLVPGSTAWNADKIELRFALTDGKNKINIIFNDVKPDNFDSGYPIIVEGKFNGSSEFVADTVKVKCPSKYEEETAAPGSAPGVKK